MATTIAATRWTPWTRDADRGAQLRRFAEELGIVTGDRSAEQIAAAIGGALDARGRAVLWIVDDLPGGLYSDDLEAWYAPAATRAHADHDAQPRVRAHRHPASTSACSWRRTGLRAADGPPAAARADEEQAARAIVAAISVVTRWRSTSPVEHWHAERGVRSFAEYLPR